MIVLLLMKSSIVLGRVDEGVIQANKNVKHGIQVQRHTKYQSILVL